LLTAWSALPFAGYLMVVSCATLTALVATAGGAKLKERAHRKIIEDLWLMSWGLEKLVDVPDRRNFRI